AIESMKRGTAPGPDNVTADFLRAGGHNLHVVLADHVRAHLQKNPGQWRTSRTVILPKKGNRRNLCNYLPICLLSVLYKLFTKIILSRISRTLDEVCRKDCIKDASSRTSMISKRILLLDHMQTMSRVIEVCREYHFPLVLTFANYEKAFDSV
ncbi:hypothetical protein Angca_008934, partial [Angiostrongylus cantonensis]